MSRRRKGLSNVKKEKKIEPKVQPKQEALKADAKLLDGKPKNKVKEAKE
jgi:hypothetical protein